MSYEASAELWAVWGGRPSSRVTAQERRQKVGRLARDRIVARDGMTCFWCQRWTFEPSEAPGDPKRRRTLDHFVPSSLGGADEDDNLVIACYDCNSERGNRMPDEWLAELDRRDAERTRSIIGAEHYDRLVP